MRCYVHHDLEAVGICKSCQKGLCPDCAVDAGHALTCKGECAQRAASVEKLIQRNMTLSETQKRVRYLYPGFIIILGVLFTGWGVSYGEPMNFSTYTGIAMLVYGLIVLRTNIRWGKETKAAGG
jgi:hypothetical protein